MTRITEIYQDPYDGIKPDLLPADEYKRRFPYGLSADVLCRYKVVGVYHSLLPRDVQDALKIIPYQAESIDDPKQRRIFKRKRLEEIIKENPDYFRTRNAEQAERIEREIQRQEIIAENRAKKRAEKKPVEKVAHPTIKLLVPRKKET